MTVALDPPLDGDGFEIAFVRLHHVGPPQTLYNRSLAESNPAGRKRLVRGPYNSINCLTVKKQRRSVAMNR